MEKRANKKVVKMLVSNYQVVNVSMVKVYTIYEYDLVDDKLKNVKDYFTEGNAKRFNKDVELFISLDKNINLNYYPDFADFKDEVKSNIKIVLGVEF